mgnify:CR=1 FL=1|jgi:hypothetical protein|tara:strand:+ start:115 stop:381 length:267 start_codon:yes stop_codon:yes gene_type:complete
MIKNTLNVIIFLFLFLSIYLFVSAYFSDFNKKKILNNRVNYELKFKNSTSELPILKNDTNDVIEFNSSFNESKSKMKRNFWNLLKINE